MHVTEDAYVAATYPDVVEQAVLLLARPPSGSQDAWRDPGFVRSQQQSEPTGEEIGRLRELLREVTWQHARTLSELLPGDRPRM
ncbi:hypothetical protein [Amycolatopsis sp. NPDC051071]|uniref:hypothetical protein n=1 Tax=Amycolatopsis sp. NPDC051071 TaxID=3154637 RepID=UPI0034354E7D